MAARKTPAKKPPLLVRAFKLTAPHEQTVSKIAARASDRIGRPVSSSAVMRGVLSFIAAQEEDWLVHEIIPRIEVEIGAGRVWGFVGKAKGKPPR